MSCLQKVEFLSTSVHCEDPFSCNIENFVIIVSKLLAYNIEIKNVY